MITTTPIVTTTTITTMPLPKTRGTITMTT